MHPRAYNVCNQRFWSFRLGLVSTAAGRLHQRPTNIEISFPCKHAFASERIPEAGHSECVTLCRTHPAAGGSRYKFHAREGQHVILRPTTDHVTGTGGICLGAQHEETRPRLFAARTREAQAEPTRCQPLHTIRSPSYPVLCDAGTAQTTPTHLD